MITTSECIKVEAMALPSLPRERKRELYLELRKAGFKAHRFALTDRAKAETRRDELKARARACGFNIDELYFYCDVSMGLAF